MILSDFLSDPKWDAPFFKMLASNDTSEASGHQGGMVIPIEIRPYFPSLAGHISAESPTLDHRLTAEMYVNYKFVGTADARYQIQTWGGDRRAESRLTDNLGPLRNEASGGDYLVIQRNVETLDLYRLLLVTKMHRAHKKIDEWAKGKRWGVLTGVLPLSTTDLAEAEVVEQTKEASAFSMFEDDAKTVESTTKKIARSLIFRKTVLDLYNSSCCMCGESLRSSRGVVGVQAAHIVSRSLKGADDARNGICLCIRHHWAFDNGLIGIDSRRRIYVPEIIKESAQNTPIILLHNKKITEAKNDDLTADQTALNWHMKNIVNA